MLVSSEMPKSVHGLGAGSQESGILKEDVLCFWSVPPGKIAFVKGVSFLIKQEGQGYFLVRL